ncbi:universal stress protein [Phytomonospora endophytica]|uniref:Nucleotide-binding universal stress UspA family protein n=1 Tax=Phytomonospora endophytica TaxID=714109 RepID=A0A841FUG9_9ACTN|nr:universal stress protein [Phytomonospora endophytica]MBB6038413.1 nucleotide-binding universal stress UspA family protein [Phytomonospora endophytica]GIG64343.1 universal stress protein [Phytomonospora endophytica]
MVKADERARIVVGIDDAPESLTALQWAAKEADASKRPMLLIHVYVPSSPTSKQQGRAYRTTTEERRHTEERAWQLVEQAAQLAHKQSAELSIETEAVEGDPYRILSDRAGNSSMLVVGSHGRGLLGRMLLGSVSTALTARPSSPVVLVRTGTREPAPDAPIVVGLDGSPASRAALLFAGRYATAQQIPVSVISCWRRSDEHGMGTPAEQEHRLGLWLAEELKPFQREFPRVRLTSSLQETRPAESLVDSSSQARLTVVGTRGPERAPEGVSGSVAQALLHHSWSPVAMVPAP